METPYHLDTTELTDPETECPILPVSYTNAKCVKNTASEPATPCVQRYMCATVTKTDNTITCDDSIISDEKEGFYKCIDSVDTEKGTICKEHKNIHAQKSPQLQKQVIQVSMPKQIIWCVNLV